MSFNAMLHKIVLQSNVFCPLFSSPILLCPLLFTHLLHYTASSSSPTSSLLLTFILSFLFHSYPVLTSPLTSCTILFSLLLSRRFGDAYCEFPKRLRVIEEVRAMVKTIMAADDSAGTSLLHTHRHTHSFTDCVSHCLQLAN
jgi:hypothetical protein